MIYGILNQKGKETLCSKPYGSRMSELDSVDSMEIYGTKVAIDFPFKFQEKPEKSFVFFGNRAGARVLAKPEWFDYYEESELPRLIQRSFELLGQNYKYRKAHEWRRHSEDLFEMLLSLNEKEAANDFPLTKALLLDYEEIEYCPFSNPILKLQTANEAFKSFQVSAPKKTVKVKLSKPISD